MGAAGPPNKTGASGLPLEQTSCVGCDWGAPRGPERLALTFERNPVLELGEIPSPNNSTAPGGAFRCAAVVRMAQLQAVGRVPARQTDFTVILLGGASPLRRPGAADLTAAPCWSLLVPSRVPTPTPGTPAFRERKARPNPELAPPAHTRLLCLSLAAATTTWVPAP